MTFNHLQKNLQTFFNSPLIMFLFGLGTFGFIFWMTTIGLPKPDPLTYKDPIINIQPMSHVEALSQVSYSNLQEIPKPWFHAPETPNLFDWGNCTYYVKSRRPDIPNDFGNANTWADMAMSEGYTVSQTPVVGAVGQTPRGYYGHVVYVEKVEGDSVYVSEMNVHGLNSMDYAYYPADEFVYIY